MLYRIGNAFYTPWVEDGAIALIKANVGDRKQINGKTYVLNQNSRWELESAPQGQMSLFDMPMVQDEPAPPPGGAGSGGGAIAGFQQQAQQFLGQIQSMSLKQLQEFDPESVLHDEHYLAALDSLATAQGIDSDDVDTTELDTEYENALAIANAAIHARILQLESANDATEDSGPSKAAQTLLNHYNELPEPETLQEWQQQKQQLQQLRNQLAEKADKRELKELDAELKELLVQYSSNPKDWEDDE